MFYKKGSFWIAVERMKSREYFFGDAVDVDESLPATDYQCSDQKKADCPYDPSSDTWRCPEPLLGQTLFRPADEVLSPKYELTTRSDDPSKCRQVPVD